MNQSIIVYFFAIFLSLFTSTESFSHEKKGKYPEVCKEVPAPHTKGHCPHTHMLLDKKCWHICQGEPIVPNDKKNIPRKYLDDKDFEMKS